LQPIAARDLDGSPISDRERDVMRSGGPALRPLASA
jgi:hypothetical protein